MIESWASSLNRLKPREAGSDEKERMFFFPSKAKILLVVGCLHLQGPDNLLDLIRVKGRRVSKVESARH